MARITDVERGARLALEIAQVKGTQPDLLDDGIPVSFWDEIADQAEQQLLECAALKAVLS